MMRSLPRQLLYAFGLTIILGSIALWVGAWWWLLIIAALVGFFIRARHPSWVMLTLFVAGLVIYLLAAGWYSWGGGTLPDSIAKLFNLGSGLVLLLVTCLIGGITTALFGGFGAYLRVVVQGKPSPS